MTLATDLLEQARYLAVREPGRPKQASLRRAISTAYYSLFHLLVDDGSRFLVGNARFRTSVARSFDHGAFRTAAQALGSVSRNPKANHWFRAHLDLPVSSGLLTVCDTLVELQEDRHKADYDVGINFTRLDATSLVSQAETAHALWRRERNTPNAQAFLAASAKLLHGTRTP